MNRNLVLLGICLLAVSFVGEAFGQKKKPRIGIAGIQIENSVFVPNRQPLVGHPVRMPDYLSPDSAMGQGGHLASHADWLWRWKRPCDKRIVRRVCGKNIGDDQGQYAI